ncbi:winged helix-turn-helix transcriptional regulator [Microvirga puerhi]|uniref:Helix-turn-helix transcriptional regulator n=1 Tax=Microvirga puerhi TaxID=2876078 RepID=A0ABS7VVD6_9HYPH|nr:helix-turn-helix domain-containing protein [Microvirga puerhi]MBZ6079020.1 helix-turn-helix transcriptional regulator [Microvirga puerhi]
MKPSHSEVPDSCRAVTELLNRIGDKWSVGVVRHLGRRKMRFTELRRSLDGISQKMLTSTLRGLERDGFVVRTVTPTIPPRVDYELTELGRGLWKPVTALGEWAQKNRRRVEAARATFDALNEPRAKLHGSSMTG